MSDSTGRERLQRALDRRAALGRPATFWLRDDDAVEPTEALHRFLSLLNGLPVTLAVIPERTGPALAEALNGYPALRVALHGWSHRNHAPASEKKQELGAHRPAEAVLAELRNGFARLSALHGPRLVPMLVPPWNRIAPALVPELGPIGIGCLSVFGPERDRGLPELNTHVDVMDWHGTRGGRPADVLMGEIAARMETMGDGATMGLLTHHLVHDAAVDRFIEELLTLTASHPGCRWAGSETLVPQA